MTVSKEREQLFKTFGKAFVSKDIELLNTVVTDDFIWQYSEASGVVGAVSGSDEIHNHMVHQADRLTEVRFNDMVWYHLDEVSFVTFNITAKDAGTGEPVRETGIEYYTIRDGRVALKDVYRKYDVGEKSL